MIYFNYQGSRNKPKNVLHLLLSNNYGGGERFNETYRDEECMIKECHPARRSFYDLLEIACTYFPATSKEELAHILTNNFSAFHCMNISKIVFVKQDLKYYPLGYKNIYEDHGIKYSKYTMDYTDQTGISYNDMLKLAKDYVQNTSESTNQPEERVDNELAGV